MRRSLPRPRGSVVLVALCFVAVIGIALAGYIAVASQAMNVSNRSFYTNTATQFAEMGLERALYALNENTWTATGWNDLSGGSVDSTDIDAKFSETIANTKYGTSRISGTIKARVYHRNVSISPSSVYWSSNNAYTTANMVYHRGVWFQCISAVSAGGSAPHLDTTKWTSVPSTWNPAATYTSYSASSGDFVVYGTSAYRCIRTHSGQLPTNTNFWTSVTLANWINSTTYTVGSLALYKGTVFRCIVAHSNQTPPNATYWAWPPVIYAEGTVTLPSSSKVIRTQIRAEFNPAPLFPNAAAASTAVTFSAASVVDSYDSNLMNSTDTWNSATAYVAGDVVRSGGIFYRCILANTNKTPASNASNWVQPAGYAAIVAGGNTGGTAVTLTSGRVNGYLAAPSNTASPYAPRTSTGTSAVVTGSAISTATPPTKIDAARVTRNVYIPQFTINFPSTSGATTLPNGTATLGTAGSSTPAVYYYNGNLNITDSRVYTINGPVQIVINGYYYQNLNSGSGAKIQIANNTSAKLEMFIAGDIAIYGSGIENLTYLPKNCVIFSSTTATAPDMSTATPFHGVVYVPNGSFKVVGVQNLFGAFSAKNLTFSAAAPLHYDTSLRTTVFTGADTPYQITSWRELTLVAEQLTL